MENNTRTSSFLTRSQTRFGLGAAALTLAVSSMVLPSLAQEAARGGDGARGADFAQRMEERRAQAAERMQAALGASDEDFAVLAPMIEGVRQLQREAAVADARGGRRGGGGGADRPDRPDRGGEGADGNRGRGGDGAAGGRGRGGDEQAGGRGRGGRDIELSPEAASIRTAMEALRTATESADTAPEVLQRDIAALRAAKAAHAAKLTAAQEQLRGAVLARQEAVLIVSGLLD